MSKVKERKKAKRVPGKVVHLAVCHERVHDRDAIGRDVVGMAEILGEMGFAVTIVACSIEGTAREKATVCTDVDGIEAKNFDALIYHHGSFWKEGEALLGRFKGPVLFKYHNVTPASFFAPYSEVLSFASEAGRRQTASLLQLMPKAWWAVDSQFNAEDLHELGVAEERIFVAPPFHSAKFEPRPWNENRNWAETPMSILFIGRVAPNKGHAALIRILAKYVETFDERVTLEIVGETHPELRNYLQELQELIAGFGINDLVRWHGSLRDEDITELYVNADVFLCMSEQEAFCIPLIEAQAIGLPVVAGRTKAVEDTLGKEQFVADIPRSEEDFLFFANLLRELQSNPGLRIKAVEQGFRNYWQRFSPERVADTFVEALTPILREVVKR